MATGPRAAARLTVDHVHGEKGTADRLDRVKPTWRLGGGHVGGERRKKAGRRTNGWRRQLHRGHDVATTAQGEHIGSMVGTRGSDPSARIHREEPVGGGFRRRPPAASKRGKHDKTTRVRFKGLGASSGFEESISGVGLGGAALRVAGDERRPPGQSRMAGEPRRAAAGAAQRATGGMGTVGSSPARENGIGGGGEKGEPAAGRVRLSWRRRSRDGATPRTCGQEEERECTEEAVSTTECLGFSRLSAEVAATAASSRAATMARQRWRVKREGLRGGARHYSGGDVGLGGVGELVGAQLEITCGARMADDEDVRSGEGGGSDGEN
uniref:OSJNBb0022P19.3 protein n=1 Tax=Oryza sativa subsp. japonica TaxID=39947 RepID=Q7XM39_ORYSJ|nr:OSJNBb0022P19.3 [Oryza sativa Japonica Group]